MVNIKDIISINVCQKEITYNSNNIQHPITVLLWNAFVGNFEFNPYKNLPDFEHFSPAELLQGLNSGHAFVRLLPNEVMF